MKRAAVLIAIAVTAASIAALLATHNSSDRYEVAVVFDTAKGTLAGQQVKIAGAVVGRVDRVGLAPGPKARLVLSIDRRFGPFRDDASCQILPEGIISENFIACDPGSASRPPIAAVAGTPTVPVSHTSVPTSLQDVMNVFALPTDDRLRVLISELGIASAGRGADLNALLRRANPALGRVTHLLSIVNRQRYRVARAVAQTDRVVSALAGDDRSVHDFLARTADVTATTGARHDALATSVHRLPDLLAATRPALRSLNRAVRQSTPILHTLRTSAPALVRATRDIPPFASAASSTLARLIPVSDAGRTMVRPARPLVGHLRSAARRSVSFSAQLDDLLRNVRDRGGIEGIMRWFYGLAATTSAYDSTSHIAGALLRVLPQCILSATTPGCTTKYNSPGQGTIPPDDPSCGPQNGAPWDPPTNCVSQTPTRSRRPKPTSILPAARLPKLPIQRPAAPRPAPVRPPLTAPRPADVKPADAIGHLLDYLLGR